MGGWLIMEVVAFKRVMPEWLETLEQEVAKTTAPTAQIKVVRKVRFNIVRKPFVERLGDLG